MLKSDRINYIREKLQRENNVTVSELSDFCDVSDVTIRGDLLQLESEGFVTRVHGGAVINEHQQNQKIINDIVAAINVPYYKEQEHIGKLAASLIQEHEWVYIGSGTTCYYIAKELLHRRNINILTNNMYVVNILLANPYINVIVCGGTLSHAHNCTVGDLFDKSISGMIFSKAFFTVSGAEFETGITVSSEIEMEILFTVKQQTKELILVIDSSKFGKKSFMHIGDLVLAGTIITDEDIPAEYREYLAQNGITVIDELPGDK